MNSIIVFAILAALLATGTPIAVAMIGTVMLALLFFTDVPMLVIIQQMFSSADSFTLMAIPFFVLSGNIMTAGGISQRLIRVATALFGGMSGGLAIAATTACAFFAAISGSSPATVAAIGAIMIPALQRAKYDDTYSVGVITSAGSLGIMIPPSIPMVVYALATGEPIGKLFMAGVVPGLMTAAVFAIMCYLAAKRGGFGQTDGETKADFKELVAALKEGFWGLMMPLIVLGGIYSGVFTPTEAAAVAVVYSAIVGSFIYKDIKLKDYVGILTSSASVSAMIMFIIISASAFSWYLTSQGIPQEVAEWIISVAPQPWMFLVAVNVLLLIVGCFMEPNSAILVLAPLFYPIVMKMNINPIHFGIVMIYNLELGLLTPPLGLNLFVASGMTKYPLSRVVKAVIPFIIAMFIMLLVYTYIPVISTWLPDLLSAAPTP
ncbi:MAG: TRAP transporter large permease subunit [Desulfuromonadaceae bacterium]|nr:TRAP transporter large permease subunit [Desulfuromonadaceae bacterium]MDD5106227.1 TRAP transporter large permease subunit [Desulfuromonadaceae bacterium]